MRSFRHKPNNRRAIYLQLAGSVESQLRQAFAKRHDEDGVTQADIAKKLGVNRSVVHRRLSGQTNMTQESLADMVWALGHCIHVEITDPLETQTNHFRILPVEDERSNEGVSSRKPQSRSSVSSSSSPRINAARIEGFEGQKWEASSTLGRLANVRETEGV